MSQAATPQRESREDTEVPAFLVGNGLGTEVLADFHNLDFDQQNYGNIVNFASSTTPKVSSSRCAYLANGEVQCTLGDIWKSLRNPYGVSVPLQGVALNPLKGQDRAVYYTPFLSGFNLTFTSSVSQKQRKEFLAPLAPGVGFSGKDVRGSQESCTSGLIWCEKERPEMRQPMFDRVKSLAETNFSGVLTARNTDFTRNSWFAIYWQPIYCQNHSQKHSAGSFLVFYLVRPDPTLHQACSSVHGVPSPICRTDTLPDFWDEPSQVAETAGGGVSLTAIENDDLSQPSTTVVREHPDSSEMGADGSSAAESNNHPGVGSSVVLETASRGSSDGAVAPACIPICGLYPIRPRNDVWFAPAAQGGFTHVAPIHLMITAVRLMMVDIWATKALDDYHNFAPTSDRYFSQELERAAGVAPFPTSGFV